jgi:hypothetical protein
MLPPDPQKRRPAAGNGRPNRKQQKDEAVLQHTEIYAARDTVARLACYTDRMLVVRHILETTEGWYYVITPDGEWIGSYHTRMEASQAIGGVTP